MRKVLIGAAIGAAGVAVTCLLVKLYKEGKFDGACDDLNAFASRRKRDFRNAVDAGKNQLEYIKERVEYGVQSGKEKLVGEDD
ncbi:hypothetical protein [Dysgonomonas sp. Marseille-P4361]|uniref:hypothetical protein n=1 Tax=Dysgonomonas sp. Marseille-P4361 TaxID=2161820 RepID=UPI000D54B662|nr:hypothetical protein [Dysgonomonas sp. Marseille-P4361]